MLATELKTSIGHRKGEKETEVSSVSLFHRSNAGLKLETLAFLPLTVANLRFQLSC